MAQKDIILLKCTSQYPADPKNVNLMTIPHMQSLFDCPIGFSDHTLGIGAAVASVAMGAVVIEKHFNLNQSDQSLDAEFSLGASQMKQLVDECHAAWAAIGKVSYGPSDEEKKSLQFRRSLYFVKSMKKGEIITPEHVKSIRPSQGLSPKYLGAIIGRTVNQDVAIGTAVSWEKIGSAGNSLQEKNTRENAELVT